MKPQRGSRVFLYTLQLGTEFTGHFTPGKETWYPIYKRLVESKEISRASVRDLYLFSIVTGLLTLC
jgi:hypothetical protein